MSNNGWDIENAVPKGVQDSLARNLDTSGALLPERDLLHEVIIQAVTERRVQVDPTRDFDEQLYNKVNEIRSSDAFAELAEKGEFTQQDVSRLLDNAGMGRLPTVPQAEHATIMVTGGPATGKTALVNSVQAQRPDIVDNAARINPDDYRALFASPGEFGQAYADMAQLECNTISKAIMSRLQERIATGDAPHVLLDVVSPNERRMALANQSNELIVVAGTKSPEAAVEHSFLRGKPTVDDVTDITVPGRQTPTFVVLEGAAKASGSNPEIFQHPNVSFELFDTNTGRNPETGRFNPPKSVASWDPETKTMTVHDADMFVDFVERQNLNDQAKSVDELFSQADRTPASIADNLSAYTDRGITIEFENPETNRVAMAFTPDGVEVNEQLPSNRGNGFFNDLAEESRVNVVSLDAAKATTDLDVSEHMRPTANLSDNFARVAGDGLQEASKLAQAARLGANAPVIGPAVGVGAAALTGLAHSGQRDHAEELRNEGVLSEEAYEAYVELNSDTENMLHTDTGLSTVDPTGLSVVVTAGVEIQARGAFKDWADEYAPHLSEDQFQSLSMSMFPDSSARNEMIMESVDHLPTSIEGQPEYLHEIINDRNSYMEAKTELSRTPVGPGPRHSQLSDAVEQMEQDLVHNMESLMSHPEGVDAVLDAVPVEDRMEYVRSLAASEGDFEQFSENHPEIAQYTQAYESSLTGWFLEEDDVLRENPDLLNDYIKERSGISTEPAEIPDSQPSSEFEDLDFSGPDATFTGDTDLAAEAAEAGISVNPELIAPEQVAATSNAIRPQIPQL